MIDVMSLNKSHSVLLNKTCVRSISKCPSPNKIEPYWNWPFSVLTNELSSHIHANHMYFLIVIESHITLREHVYNSYWMRMLIYYFCWQRSVCKTPLVGLITKTKLPCWDGTRFATWAEQICLETFQSIKVQSNLKLLLNHWHTWEQRDKGINRSFNLKILIS